MENSPNNYQPQMGNTQSPQSPSVPPPPQPEVTVRTMESDIKSIQEQGGAMPVPEKVSPSSFDNNTPVFQPSTNDVATPVSGGNKKWLWSAVVIILIAASAVYYFYFYNNQSSVNVGTPVVEQNSPDREPVTQPTSSVKITLEELTKALQAEAGQPLPAGNLKEVALVDEGGQSVSFFNLFSILLPDLAESSLADVIKSDFEDKFNAYLYYDANGVWPIYKVSLKNDSATNIISLKNKLAVIENAAINNFYLDFPGPQNAFNNGQVNGYSTRYASFAQPGASFNYGLIDGELIFSTSYNGLKKLLE